MSHFMPVTPSAPAPVAAPNPATALSLGLGQFPELGLPVSCWTTVGLLAWPDSWLRHAVLTHIAPLPGLPQGLSFLA